MKYKIEPIDTKRWHGKSLKEFKPAPVKVLPVIDVNKLKYKTGLTEEDIKYLRSRGIELDLSDNYVPGKAHPFWDSPIAVAELRFETMLFDDENPMDYIKIRFLKEHPILANSQEELEEGKWPRARFVVVNSKESIKRKAKKIEKVEKAMLRAAKMSKQEKLDILLVLEGVDMSHEDMDTLTVALNNLIQSDPETFLKYADMDKEDFEILIAIKKALRKGIIQRGVGGAYKYLDLLLGYSEIEMLHFFKNPDNKEILTRLMDQTIG